MSAARRDTYVVDIETVGVSWETLDERTREYLLGRAGSEAEREAVPRRLGLAAGTGRVIVIGMLNVSGDGRGGVLVEGEPKGWRDDGPQGFRRFTGDERALLEQFWSIVGRASRVVTYNGRGFDGPFLMLRSAMHGLAPSVNMAGYRYDIDPHCDVADILSFRGATRENYSLDYWCRRFGITSPKEQGLDGARVQEYYEDGRLEEIVGYCVRDVVATAALYAALERTLLPLFGRGGRR